MHVCTFTDYHQFDSNRLSLQLIFLDIGLTNFKFRTIKEND